MTSIEHRNRTKHVYTFHFVEYENYAEERVKELSEDKLLDETKFWHTNKHDLVYCGFNVLFFKAFLSTKTKNQMVKLVATLRLGSTLTQFYMEPVRQTNSSHYNFNHIWICF